MNLELRKEVIDEISRFSSETQQYIWKQLQELKHSPVDNSSVDTLKVQGRMLFRYVMKEDGRGGKRDHRAVFDIREDNVVIYAVFHRDRGYQKDEIAKRF